MDIQVPDIGDFESVEIIEIHIKPGDTIALDAPLITLESDKASMDIPAPVAGVVQTVHVKVGDKVSQGSLIAQMAPEEAAATPAGASPPARDIPPPSRPTLEVTKPIPPRDTPNPISQHAEFSVGKNPHASPAVRKFARELGANLQLMQGSGFKNRITKEDVQAWVKQELEKSRPKDMGIGISITPAPVIDFSQFGDIEIQALSRIKKLSGANLHRNWVNIPHVTQFELADITDLDAFRKSMQEDASQRGIKLTLLAFLMKAAANALRSYPRFNSSLTTDGTSLVLKKYMHIGFACDTPDGLVVPVIRDVNHKDVLEIARDLNDLSVKARERKLKLEEMQGGCFTISSLGGIGGTAFTPIINAPEVAILGVSRANMLPAWNKQTSAFEPRLTLPLSLSYDHRVVDGAEGARFTSHLCMVLSDVRRLLL